MPKWEIDIKFIEQGDIYFFYKPRKNVEKVSSLADVARFYFVLTSENEMPPARYIVMGGKKMPDIKDGGEASWGFVQMVGGRGFAVYKNTENYLKGASRPAGEGIYTIITHRDHTHLLYSLELPLNLGSVQKAFNIQKEANYIFLERSNETSPVSLDSPFSNFSNIEPKELNKKGTEILLVGIGSDIGRLGIRAEKDTETLKSADIFSQLNLSPKRHYLQALISGEWV